MLNKTIPAQSLSSCADAFVHDRNNNLGPDGWNAVMEAVADASHLACLNGVEGLSGLVAGGCPGVELASRGLDENELAICVARLLPRSSNTLTLLDLR